ncbi:MAG: DUF1553 domain-containing protein [Planctomycetota bacterium]
MLGPLIAAAFCAPQLEPVEFERSIAPIFATKCVRCHGPEKQRSGYRLDVRSIAFDGGESSAPNIRPGDAAGSPLLRLVSGLDEALVMPPKGDRLTPTEVALVRRWIDEGAPWPDSASAQVADPLDWWSLKPITRPAPSTETGNPIDAFVTARLARAGLALAGEADARTLCRRVHFDLIGLPPTPEEMDAYIADPASDRFERLVDRLLASPRYGERWARHWLDVVHYGDTHGYDKDQPRPNAWPYRDYVIRAFNEDKPYARFVEEQLAGDALYPGTRDGIEALGFIAAGPWDLIGHEELPEEKIDGMFARHFDRDDMVGNALGTFTSVTAQCAQCHDHKFDPISQEDYYALQAVFAGIDRADKRFDEDPMVAARRAAEALRKGRAEATLGRLDAELVAAGGAALAALDAALAGAAERPEYGFHSAIEADAKRAKWVQLDLGAAVSIERVVLAGARDAFNGIGAGFGFPVRFRVESSLEPDFVGDVTLIASREAQDFPNPGIEPVVLEAGATQARYLRLTVTQLAPRSDDFIFALAELQVFDGTGRNAARGATVTSLDSIEAPPRWRRANLPDGFAPALEDGARAALVERRDALLERLVSDASRRARAEAESERELAVRALAALPPQRAVYAGTVVHGTGNFRGTGGTPREIRVLARGQVTEPGAVAAPAALSALDPLLPSRFALADTQDEALRRAALARWITDPRNPLTWRTIVNRVWQHHFGAGLVTTPNDFGRMGAAPTHPELLDWLAAWLRDDAHGSLKSLHRLIVTSRAYRQRSDVANEDAEALDSGNTLLWRGNTRKLEAEAVHDAVLAVSGALDLTMGGPGYQDFVIEQPEHSPHYRYDLADPNDPRTFRRAIYRFIVRSQMQPFMTSLDCADPSLRVDRRNESLSPNQALAYLNNGFMLAQAQRFAGRVQREAGPDLQAQLRRAFQLALGRPPEPAEGARLGAFAARHGLENACRVLLNLNEFSFID